MLASTCVNIPHLQHACMCVRAGRPYRHSHYTRPMVFIQVIHGSQPLRPSHSVWTVGLNVKLPRGQFRSFMGAGDVMKPPLNVGTSNHFRDMDMERIGLRHFRVITSEWLLLALGSILLLQSQKITSRDPTTFRHEIRRQNLHTQQKPQTMFNPATAQL